ncbi:prepilin-type N-terminal cleavage/methylation domain-containing protein [Pseudoalteromonas tunicata]|jgi:prepilin-type N-terminal cleavage/methylation domain-containing protein|nr:prepilin-type N-terminal cleavage/methylation domain-containing protein [Pseudoalteromonas tunicata]AXT32436.1 prepilin-type N-terminal cleavage/methylation domain-containing protein [Pseudoalteromonas tunicata]
MVKFLGMNKNGFTLIELLITTTILSLLLFLGSFSYQLLANRWDKQLGTFDRTLELTRNIELLENVISGIEPAVINDEKQGTVNYGFFFIGTESRLLSITEKGLFSKKYPEIFLLSLESAENETFNLVYQSVSTENVLLLSAQQEIVFDHRYLLLGNIKSFKLSYLGWDNIIAKSESSQTGVLSTWRDDFSGLDSQALPNEIEVFIDSERFSFSFSSDIEKNSLRYLTPYLEGSQ